MPALPLARRRMKKKMFAATLDLLALTPSTLTAHGAQSFEGLCCLNRNASKLRRWSRVLTTLR